MGMIASLLCGSANALTSGPPPISKSSSSRAGEFTVQKGISDDDFQTSERLDTAYAMARRVVAQGDMTNALKSLRIVAEAGHFLAMHDLALLLRQANTKESFAEAAMNTPAAVTATVGSSSVAGPNTARQNVNANSSQEEQSGVGLLL
jgi:hypothetical protein